MQSKPKKNSVITSRIPEGVQMVTVSVRIPAHMLFEVREADGSLHADHIFDLTKVHADNLGRAIVHGMNQRIPDAAAIGVTDKEGDIIPRAERTRIKSEKMNEVIVHYESGTAEWNRRPSGDGFGAKSVVVEAASRALGVTYDEAKAKLERRAKETNRTYQKMLTVARELYAAQVAEVEAERNAKRPTIEIDADAEMEALKSMA